ncbi:LPXTG cell wall anchor domain-containing protein [Micromonospora sp. NPDC023956]|uniref:LPXTG cell wall anchor domain-containing protein n=1 Tax=Micromonospora sp. NPDC023956 TaxID=3155722 RepID=UPI0033D446A1
MNLFTRSALARTGAVTLITAGLVAVGAPAQAADQVDLALIPLSGQIAKGVSEAKAKPFKFTVDNSRGTADARDVTVTVDARKVNQKKIGFFVPGGCQEQGKAVYSCVLGDLSAGTSEDFGIPLFSTGKRGAAGTLVVSITSATADANLEDNTVEVDLNVTKPGYDLVTWAQDVYADVVVDGDEETGLRPVRPGETAPLDWAVYNGGSRRATGLFYGITLPAGVSFVELPKNCVQEDFLGLAQAFCDDPAVVLKPGEFYSDIVRVKVAKEVAEPVLRIGHIFAAGLDQVGPGEPESEPEVAAPAQRRAFDEVDEIDNNAVFDVFVDLSTPTPGPSGSPSVSPSVPPAAGGGGGDGGLPVTGVQAGLIGGVGGTVLLLGGALLVLSRRRRVVLVTPADERSTD